MIIGVVIRCTKGIDQLTGNPFFDDGFVDTYKMVYTMINDIDNLYDAHNIKIR